MDKIKYKGVPTLLLDTDDLVIEREKPFDIRRLMKVYDVKKVVVITSLPFHSLPMDVREMVNTNDDINCFRGGIT